MKTSIVRLFTSLQPLEYAPVINIPYPPKFAPRQGCGHELVPSGPTTSSGAPSSYSSDPPPSSGDPPSDPPPYTGGPPTPTPDTPGQYRAPFGPPPTPDTPEHNGAPNSPPPTPDTPGQYRAPFSPPPTPDTMAVFTGTLYSAVLQQPLLSRQSFNQRLSLFYSCTLEETREVSRLKGVKRLLTETSSSLVSLHPSVTGYSCLLHYLGNGNQTLVPPPPSQRCQDFGPVLHKTT